jgi:hypothetical protein
MIGGLTSTTIIGLGLIIGATVALILHRIDLDAYAAIGATAGTLLAIKQVPSKPADAAPIPPAPGRNPARDPAAGLE